MTYETMKVYLQVFLVSALDQSEQQLHDPATLALGERAPCTHWTGGWVGPRAGLNTVEKRKSPVLARINPNFLVIESITKSLYWVIVPMVVVVVL
jgi:hypothetical protein